MNIYIISYNGKDIQLLSGANVDGAHITCRRSNMGQPMMRQHGDGQANPKWHSKWHEPQGGQNKQPQYSTTYRKNIFHMFSWCRFFASFYIEKYFSGSFLHSI